MSNYAAILKTGFGMLGVRTEGEAISEIIFLPGHTRAQAPLDAAAKRACAQIKAYLDDPQQQFDLPLKPAGTPFQRRVWRAIAAIPHGRTLTYGDIARELKTAPRAVGRACGDNPYPVVVPCHRVVAAGSKLGGFAHSREGLWLDIKRWLLHHEGVL